MATKALADTMERHPAAELAVVCKWGSGTSHYAWVGGWDHSVDLTTVLGKSMVVARPPLPTLCGSVLRGPWPFQRAGDLVMCADDPATPTCRRCRRLAPEMANGPEGPSPVSDRLLSRSGDSDDSAEVVPNSWT
jgi:hypothetical protein